MQSPTRAEGMHNEMYCKCTGCNKSVVVIPTQIFKQDYSEILSESVHEIADKLHDWTSYMTGQVRINYLNACK